MESTNKILSFWEFSKLGSTGDNSMGTQLDMPMTDVPSTDSEISGQASTGDHTYTSVNSPMPAQAPNAEDTENNVPVHMIDDQTGEAEAETQAEPNVQIEGPTGSDEK